MFRRIAASLALCACLAAGPFARATLPDTSAVPGPAAPANSAPMVYAHPALWRVHGKHGTIVLLGSLHLLPDNVVWRTPEIERAIAQSDVFVFEVPVDNAAQAKIQALIADKGALPAGQSLRAMLTPAAQADYDADLAALQISIAIIDNRRPWLASLVLSVMEMKSETGQIGLGPDFLLSKEAAAAHKEMRYLETLDQQIALIVPGDTAVELQEFEADLKEMRSEKNEYPDFIAAWSTADITKIDALMNGGFAHYPDARKALLDDRNKAWVVQFAKMLDEDHTFFVTVGAGHLAGPQGVPALLRAKGYRVEGP